MDGAKLLVYSESRVREKMEFCEECGGLIPAGQGGEKCNKCDPSSDEQLESRATPGTNDRASSDQHEYQTSLETLPTTASGSIKKADAMEWLEARGVPSRGELKQSIVEKPSDFTGSTFPTDISTIRVTGDPQFIETVAGLFSWIGEMEDASRRVEINLKETEDREDGRQTGNYALYLSVTERG